MTGPGPEVWSTIAALAEWAGLVSLVLGVVLLAVLVVAFIAWVWAGSDNV